MIVLALIGSAALFFFIPALLSGELNSSDKEAQNDILDQTIATPEPSTSLPEVFYDPSRNNYRKFEGAPKELLMIGGQVPNTPPIFGGHLVRYEPSTRSSEVLLKSTPGTQLESFVSPSGASILYYTLTTDGNYTNASPLYLYTTSTHTSAPLELPDFSLPTSSGPSRLLWDETKNRVYFDYWTKEVWWGDGFSIPDALNYQFFYEVNMKTAQTRFLARGSDLNRTLNIEKPLDVELIGIDDNWIYYWSKYGGDALFAGLGKIHRDSLKRQAIFNVDEASFQDNIFVVYDNTYQRMIFSDSKKGSRVNENFIVLDLKNGEQFTRPLNQNLANFSSSGIIQGEMLLLQNSEDQFLIYDLKSLQFKKKINQNFPRYSVYDFFEHENEILLNDHHVESQRKVIVLNLQTEVSETFQEIELIEELNLPESNTIVWMSEE